MRMFDRVQMSYILSERSMEALRTTHTLQLNTLFK